MGRKPFHDSLERCPFCGQYMTYEQAKHHICNSPLVDVKEIAIMYHYETCDKNGDTVIMARGWDGVLYRLRKSKHPIRRRFTEPKSDKDLTEPLIVS